MKAIINILDDLKHYEGSIIQRKIISKKEGSIILYAIDNYETIPEHRAKYIEFVYVLDGMIEIIVEGIKKIVPKYSLYTIFPNQKHIINGYDNGKFALIILKDKV